MSLLNRWIRRAPACAVAVLLAGAPSPAFVDPPETWITLAQKDAAYIGEQLAKQGRADTLVVETEGEVVVARIREDAIPLLAQVVHESFHRCSGFVAHTSRQAALEASARGLNPPSPESLIDYTIDNGPVVQALMANLQETNVRSTISSLAAFFTRYHNCATGAQSSNWIRDRWTEYAAGRPDVTVQSFTHTGYPTQQPSVILTIPGQTLPSEVVVLGAHQDSIAGSNCSTSRAPGADDDASGVASLSEVIRVALALGYRPNRTVKFMAYAAEEVGLRGSAEIAQLHFNEGTNVVGVLQLDMTNFKGTPSADIVLYTDFTNAAQNTFLGQLNDTYLGLPRTTSACGYGCSDHASWHNRGFVASFPFEAVFGQHNSTIHTQSDTLAQSGNNANQALKFSKLAAAYLAEIAKGGFSGGNQPPTANAGPNQTVTAGTQVTLAGSGNDPDGGPSPLTYAWSQVSGTSVTINNANQATATVTPTTAGPYVFRLTVSDGLAQGVDEVTVTATSGGGAQTAAYDAVRRAPRCTSVGTSCDSGALLNGRDGRGPEVNQPNTVNASCSDGTSGTYHVDESNDRIRVFTLDGTNLSPGKTVRIEATVWAYTTPSADRLDLYRASNGLSPSWVHVATLTPSAPGAQTLSATYTLPQGGVQAVRARFRYQGSATPCGRGSYNDHDDLVFAVDSGIPAAPDLTADFDGALGAPRCASGGRSCDSGPTLLLGRSTHGPEPHQPNSLAAACPDGGSGTFHIDESNDRLKVSAVDDAPLAPGVTVQVDADVWAHLEYAADRLDLYYAADAVSPSWTLIATLAPTRAGAQTLSATYTLPAGALQAVRARFRYGGVAGSCGPGAYDDHDDLVFAVP
jgi:bacterial leucyl aminopeptidase